MKPYRIRIGYIRSLAFLSVAAAIALVGTAAAQSTYPSQTIRLIIGFPAGGISDTLARLIGDAMSRRLGVAVVVEPRPGAGGLVGAEACARSAPDGHTLCVGTAPVHSVHQHLGGAKLTWDPATAFVPVTLISTEPTVIAVSAKLGITDPAGFVEWLRRQPDAAYATGGHGTTSHLLGAALGKHLGLSLEHIPYRGSQQAILAGISGDVPIVVTVAGGIVPFVRSGELRAIGISSTKPNPSLPGVLPLSQTILPQARFSNYLGIFAPSGTPGEIVAKVAETLRSAIADPDLREAIERLGVDPVFGTPAEFAAFLRESSEDFRTLVDLSGVGRKD